MKPVRLNLVSNTAQAFIEYNAVRDADDGLATHVLLPIEGDSVGGLDPDLQRLVDVHVIACRHGNCPPTLLKRWEKLATAIEEILKGADDA
jgi:hypothetical protein